MDPTLPRTIQRALAKADMPDQLVFGVGLQYDVEPDLSFIPDGQLRTISWNPANRPGIVKIRYEISKLFKDEDYFLMIDSHMDFVDGWDTKLINIIKSLQDSDNSYRVGLLPLGLYGDEAMGSRFDIEVYQAEGFPLCLNSVPVNTRYVPTQEIEQIYFMRVGQIFFDGRFIKEVGLDSISHYNQEQAYLGYRAFMSGWNVYQYHQNIMMHDDIDYLKQVDQIAAKQWGTVSEVQNSHRDMTMAYVYNTGPYAIANAVRTPEEYWNFNGCIDKFSELKMSLDAYLKENKTF
jgi:hypothetical protein